MPDPGDNSGLRTTFARMSPMMIKRTGTSQKLDKQSVLAPAGSETDFNRESVLSKLLFPGIPTHYPLKKKILLTKNNSTIGSIWDSFQIVLCLAACAVFIINTYTTSYYYANALFVTELVITQFFMVDFILNMYLYISVSYITDIMTLVDVITILPVYLTLGTDQNSTNLGFFRFIRLLRLARIFRTFKMLRSLSGVKRQMISLSLTLLCMTFLAAGVIQLLENDVAQMSYDCVYINESTGFEPSCTDSAPATEDCDCIINNCVSNYKVGDRPGEPQEIQCTTLTFFDAFYFIVVTTATVGYGDISPNTTYGRAFIVCFIIFSLVVIPIQINKLQVLLSLRSPFREPYSAQSHENHIILCGHVNEKGKLEKFFKEFFHPDRALSSSPDFHAVILGLGEPSEEVRSLLVSPMLDTRVTYVIGSALSVEDLKRARAETAAGIFFLCNTEIQKSSVHIEDAATVLRSLSVANFSPTLRSLVQIIRPEDKGILKDSDVDVILCLDEFKTALIARNAICPGFSTFIENMFHSFGNVSTELEESMDPWYREYLHGARKEIYYAALPERFFKVMSYNFRNIGPAIYIEFGIIVLGVCELETQDIVLNPTIKDIKAPHTTFKEFFEKYNVAVILADDQLEADELVRALNDPLRLDKIVDKMTAAEQSFKTKHYAFSNTGNEKKSVKNLKFFAKNIIAPLRNTAKSAKRRFSKYSKIGNNAACVEAAAIEHEKVLKPSSMKPLASDENSSSDDENEAAYIGFRGNRVVSELHTSVQGKSMFKKAIAKKKEMDLMKLAEGAKTEAEESSVESSAAQQLHVAVDDTAPPTVALEAEKEPLVVGESGSSKVGQYSSTVKMTANQQDDLLKNTITNDQVLKALKRKSEPARGDSKKSEKSSAKRRSEPPPAKPSIEDSLVPPQLKDKPVGGPPLEMANPQSPLLSRKIELPPLSSFAEEATVLGAGSTAPSRANSPRNSSLLRGISRELKPLSKKESSDKLNARSSAKIKKIKQQVRKNLIVVKSTKGRCGKSGRYSSRSLNPEDGVEAFRRLESDLSNGQSSDAFDEKSAGAPTPKGNATANSAQVDDGLRLDSFGSLSVSPPKRKLPQIEQRLEDATKAEARGIEMTGQQIGQEPAISHVDASEEKSETPEEAVPVQRSLSARNKKMGNIVGTLLTINKTVKKWTEIFGKNSCEVESAEDLKRHIIVFGPDPSSLILFISELRRPAVRRLDYHPILIVGTEPPPNWKAICDRFNDVYFIRGYLTKTSTFKKLNIQNAFSMVLFTFNDPRALKDASDAISSHNTPDADALFMYLKLQQYIPDNVFFFVELKTASNISVLNATMIRRMRERAEHTAVNDVPSRSGAPRTRGQAVSALAPPLLSSLSSKYFGANDTHTDGLSGKSTKSAASMKANRKINILEEKKSERMFWDAMDTHHVLPVFASGKVYVPETFETLLVQSFYNTMTPIICDKLVCGQKGQAVMQAKLPRVVDGWSFMQLYRMFSQFQVIVFGLFRAPSSQNCAYLPYLFICPPLTTVLRHGDAVMVYARNANLIRALAAAEKLSNLEYSGL